jgi:tyrosyl-tRNA synthetase
MSKNVVAELQSRGLVAFISSDSELAEHLAGGCRTLYCGFDPTADSLHVGSLVPLLALRRFQQAGHRPVALVGGATGMIGDPSFKTKERKLNTLDTTRAWTEKIRAQVSRFVDFDCGENSAVVVNNYDWTASLDVLTFLRDIGKHFSVNSMVQKESVRQRLEREGDGISFTEFTYMILQAYDFAVLNRDMGCTLQIGGSDQWGNIAAGIDLSRRLNQQQVFGLTLPLITKSDGTKFGKTEDGTIWLDSSKTSAYAFYQFWLNTADADVYRFIRFFTFLPVEEVSALEIADKAAAKPEAQRVLAKEVTRLVHGNDGLMAAERITDALFTGQFARLSSDDFQQLALDGLPCSRCAGMSVGLVELLVSSGLASSNRMAREFIANGSVQVNGEKISDVGAQLPIARALLGKYFLIRRGKKHFHLVVLGD